jgi:hypothetical protein
MSVVQLENANTQLEKDFFELTAPTAVRLLREISDTLRAIHEEIKRR